MFPLSLSFTDGGRDSPYAGREEWHTHPHSEELSYQDPQCLFRYKVIPFLYGDIMAGGCLRNSSPANHSGVLPPRNFLKSCVNWQIICSLCMHMEALEIKC